MLFEKQKQFQTESVGKYFLEKGVYFIYVHSY